MLAQEGIIVMAPTPVTLARATLVGAATATLLTLSGTAFSQQASINDYQYLSPSPGSRFVSPQNTVVFREGRALDPASVGPGLVAVVGSVSGPHDGSLVVASDGRTLVFRPSIPFTLGETVQVALQTGLRASDGSELPPVEFAFDVGMVNPRDQLPLLGQIDEYGGGAGGAESTPAEPAETQATCTDLPTGFPPYNVSVYNNPDPGYLFLTPFSGQSGGNIAIIDNFGQPLFFQHFPRTIHDFEAQPNGLLTYFATRPASGVPKFFALDQTFAVVDSFAAGNGYVADTHELLFLPNGHFLLMIYDPQPVRMDLVVPGGNPDATVVGLVLQELDADRNVVFQWRSWDHMNITDAVNVDLTASNVDYAHGNGLDVMPDGNLLLSSRHLSEITKIDRQTGEIIWRMGAHAKNNQFTFVNDPRGCSYQHDVRWLPNGHMTVFDNGNFLSPQYTRMVEYAVDEVNKVATEVMEYQHTPSLFARFLGSVRRQASGKTLIGWGGAADQAKVTELNPDGSVSLELGGVTNILSYRALRSTWRGGLLVTDETLDCGIANPGQTVVRKLSVRNGSSQEVTINCAVSSDAQFVVTTPLPLTLAAGAEVMLDVAFTPSAKGARSGKIYLRAPTATQFVAQDVTVTGVGNSPPDCTQAYATPSVLWPPDHGMVPVAINGVTDPDGDDVTITVTGVKQNEPLDGVGDGSTCPDAMIGSGGVQVRAERSAKFDGRIYDITFRAEDPHGGASTGLVRVTVPHDVLATTPQPLSAQQAKHPDDPAPPNTGNQSPATISSVGPCPAHLDGEINTGETASPPDPMAWTLSLGGVEVVGSRASVKYTLPADGDARLAVFDLLGRKVSTLLDGHQTAGVHQVDWSTAALKSGIYFYRLRAGDASVSKIVRIVR